MAGMRKQRQANAGFLATVKELVVLLLIVFIIRTFGFGLYQVPTGSMETTMLVGERFFADKFTILYNKPQHGEIISFNDPLFKYSSNYFRRLFEEYVYGPMNWTKRVIGMPGDTIKGVVENGKPVVYRNGQKLDEPYLNKYPLLAIWVEDPEKLHEWALHEALTYMRYQEGAQEEVEKIASRLLCSKIDFRSYDPHAPYNQQPFYRVSEKRVIHVIPQDCAEQGVTVTPDGRLLKEPGVAITVSDFPKVQRGASYWNGTDEFYVELGDNEYWLMGDNRRGSHDCRVFGPVPQRLIHGKIIFRIWSLDSSSKSWLDSWWIIDLIKHPIDFWSRLRWSRFFQRVH